MPFQPNLHQYGTQTVIYVGTVKEEMYQVHGIHVEYVCIQG